MGSLSRVNVIYTEIFEFLKSKNLPIYAADLKGENLRKVKLVINVFGFLAPNPMESLRKSKN